MKTVEASVIVPVYNAKIYLRRCLDSIKKQTFADFEVIVIDDGSTDGSGTICDAYAAEDPRFKVFHQKNIGVTKTREIGIQKANGDYIFWVDADDYADPVLIERVMGAFHTTSADIIQFSIQEFGEQGPESPEIMSTEKKVEERRKEVVLGINSELWHFAARKLLWEGEKAPEEVSRSAADGYMAVRLFMKAESIHGIADLLYYHLLDSPYSISHTFTGRKYLGNFFLWNYRMNLCKQYFPEKVSFCAPRVLSNGVKSFCMAFEFQDIYESERKEIIQVLEGLRRQSISGRYRDKILSWAIRHGHWGICRFYAHHKVEKSKKKNEKMRQHALS